MCIHTHKKMPLYSITVLFGSPETGWVPHRVQCWWWVQLLGTQLVCFQCETWAPTVPLPRWTLTWAVGNTSHLYTKYHTQSTVTTTLSNTAKVNTKLIASILGSGPSYSMQMLQPCIKNIREPFGGGGGGKAVITHAQEHVIVHS